jgi:hypothetical protein
MAVTWRITNWDDVVPSLKNFRLQYAEGGQFIDVASPSPGVWTIDDRDNAGAQTGNDVSIIWDNSGGGSDSVEDYDGNSTVKILTPGGVVCQLDWLDIGVVAWWFSSNSNHGWYTTAYKNSLASTLLRNELYPSGWDNAGSGNASVGTVDIKIILHAKGGGNGLNTSSLYRVNELGSLFEPRVVGDPILANETGIFDGGSDLRVRYYPVTGVTTNDGRPGGGTKIPGKELSNTGFCSHAYRSGLEYVHQDPSSRIGSDVVSNQGLLGYYNGDNDDQQGGGGTTYDLAEGKNEFGENHSSQFPQPAGNPDWAAANPEGWWPGADGDQPYFTGQDIRHLFAAVGTVAVPVGPIVCTDNLFTGGGAWTNSVTLPFFTVLHPGVESPIVSVTWTLPNSQRFDLDNLTDNVINAATGRFTPDGKDGGSFSKPIICNNANNPIGINGYTSVGGNGGSLTFTFNNGTFTGRTLGFNCDLDGGASNDIIAGSVISITLQNGTVLNGTTVAMADNTNEVSINFP